MRLDVNQSGEKKNICDDNSQLITGEFGQHSSFLLLPNKLFGGITKAKATKNCNKLTTNINRHIYKK